MFEEDIKAQLATLTEQIKGRGEWLERVERKIDTQAEVANELHVLASELHNYVIEDRRRHDEHDKRSDASDRFVGEHITRMLPIIDEFRKMQGEETVNKGIRLLISGGLGTVIAGLVVQYIGKH